MNSPVISVIMPCFNRERYLEAALQSVLWQTFTEWECILVDDGSTDCSAAIFHQHADRDDRFRYLHEENQGPSAARNLAMGIARGEFVQFLDSDDIIPPGRFRRCVDQFRQQPDTDVVYTNYVGYRRREGFVRSLPARIPGNDPLKAFLFEQNETFATVIHSFLCSSDLLSLRIHSTRRSGTLPKILSAGSAWQPTAFVFRMSMRCLPFYRYSEDSLCGGGVGPLCHEDSGSRNGIREIPAVRALRRNFAAGSRRMHQRLAWVTSWNGPSVMDGRR